MNDERIWNFEESLWTADAEHYRESIADDALMVVPQPPYAMSGKDAADAMAGTPRWDSVEFSDTKVSRPEGDKGGLIVIAYKAEAARGDEKYAAWCSSTYQRLEHENWVVIQHQQTPPVAGS